MTRGAKWLGHVSIHYSLPTLHVSTLYSPKNPPIRMRHVTPLPRHQCHAVCTVATSARWYGPPRGRTDCTDRYSQHSNFDLFDLAVKLRYLLHTDSIRENKYTAGIRKTRRTQWCWFHRIPSTFIFEHFSCPDRLLDPISDHYMKEFLIFSFSYALLCPIICVFLSVDGLRVRLVNYVTKNP